jgi:hypothetical protein
MDLQTILPCALLLLACVAWIFWPQRITLLSSTREKTRLDYLRERKEVIYDNLRDLNFEYRSGKFPEEDYARQRDALEAEAAHVLAEMDQLATSV